MRALLLCSTIFGAVSSAAFAGAPQCTLPNAGAIQVADRQASQGVSPPPSQPSILQIPQPAAGEVPVKVPASVAAFPFVEHVAAAGATVSDFGLSHGMHTISARNGDQFMIFQITPDGQAAVSGALTELTFAQLTTAAGGNVTPLASQHGMDTLFVRSGAQFQVFYVTPDKERVIPGVLWDSAGKDLTRDQVKNVPGAIPTVTVGDIPGGNSSGAPAAAGAAALPLVQKASSGTVGPVSAPHLWLVIDPQCIYSVRAYQMLHPFVVAGKLQLSIIPISVLDYEDNGQSTKSALALLSKSPDQLVSAWQAGSVNDPPDPAAAERLQANGAIAQAIGLQGTPTLIWKKQDGTEGRINGMPTSIDALISSIGS